MTTSKLKTGAIGALAIVVGLTLMVGHRWRTKLREQDALLQQRAKQMAVLQQENTRLANALANPQRPQSLAQAQLAELVRLRSEVAALRQQTDDGQSLNLAQRVRALEAPLSWLKQISAGRFEGLTGDELLHLRELDLSNLAVADQDLAHLQGLPSLRRLNLRNTQITDAGLAALQSIGTLTQLELRQTKITDAGMEHLRKIPNLRHLDLNTTQVTDAGLAQVRELNQLQFLRLNSTQISDAGLAHLSTLENLKRLDLWGNRLSEQGMNQIWNLPSLVHLEYGATGISREWTENFQKAHPHVFIVAPDFQSTITPPKP